MKKKVYRVHLFYIIDQKALNNIRDYPGICKEYIIENDNDSMVRKYALYAFTPDSNIAEFFWKTRKHKKFYRKMINMDESDYEDFCKEYEDALLEYHCFNTKTDIMSNVPNYITDVVLIKVLATRRESDIILYHTDTKFMDLIERELPALLAIKDPKAIFKPVLLELLDNAFNFSNIISDIAEYATYSDSIGCYSAFKYVDELAMYIKLFSNTMNNPEGE